MFSRVANFFTQLLEPFKWSGRSSENLKRKRHVIDENDMVDEAIPRKKSRENQILTESNILLRNVKTQTDVLPIFNARRPLIRPYAVTYDLTQEPSSSVKENWCVEKDIDKKSIMSPVNKNKYKPPPHCRSPGRGLRGKTLFNSEPDEDVQYVQSITVSPKGQKSLQAVIPVAKPSSSCVLPRRSIVQTNTPRSLTRNSRALNQFMKQHNITRYDVGCKEKYKELLGSLLKDPLKYPRFHSNPITEVDLTGVESDEEDVVEVPFTLPPNVSVRQKPSRRSRKVECIDLTKTPLNRRLPTITIDLSKDDEVKVVERPQVAKVNTLEKVLQDLPITHGDWITELTEKYRKLRCEKVEKRDKYGQECSILKNLNELKLDDLLNKELEKHLKITEALLFEKEKAETILPELTPEMNAKIDDALNQYADDSVTLSEKFGYTIKRRDLLTLKGLCWLNDEVINFYMSLLMERGKQKDYPSVYAFNTFFYEKVSKSGQSSVRRWTRKVDIFSHDLIVIPIHLKLHWCLASIDLSKKTVNYYDSMGSPNTTCLKSLLKYLEDEMKDKKSETFDSSSWTLTNVSNIPQQMNGSDCGIFACTFAEFICRRASFTFNQSQMQYFRRKMVYEILKGELLM